MVFRRRRFWRFAIVCVSFAIAFPAGTRETFTCWIRSRLPGLCASAPSAALGLLVAFAGTPALANAPGKWNYLAKGADWGAEFPACEGKFQTPVDFREKDVTDTGSSGLTQLLNYKPVDMEIFNNGGKTMQANGNFGFIKLPDGFYDARQFHFHFPAEHAVDGKLAAGELHFVHQKRGAQGTNDLVVIGILLKATDASDGPEGAWMRKLGFGGDLPATEGAKIPIAKVDMNAFASQFGGGFFHYRGSLTTPPCSETVHWYVLKRGAPVTKAMIDSFKARFPSNNRGLTPLNGRFLLASGISLPGEY